MLQAGTPVGFLSPGGWPGDYWASTQRLSNALLRPVRPPGDTELVFGGVESVPPGVDASAPSLVARCGPYVLVRAR